MHAQIKLKNAASKAFILKHVRSAQILAGVHSLSPASRPLPNAGGPDMTFEAVSSWFPEPIYEIKLKTPDVR